MTTYSPAGLSMVLPSWHLPSDMPGDLSQQGRAVVGGQIRAFGRQACQLGSDGFVLGGKKEQKGKRKHLSLGIHEVPIGEVVEDRPSSNP